jgi:hypothetical protein
MVKKQIQKHNFLTGGPVIQFEIPFDNLTVIGTETTSIVFGTDLNWGNMNQFVTEDRVREMVREYMDQLRGEQL